MNKTKVVKCTCEHKFQDAEYGKGMRMTTPGNKAQQEGTFIVRCTVCKKEHNLGRTR